MSNKKDKQNWEWICVSLSKRGTRSSWYSTSECVGAAANNMKDIMSFQCSNYWESVGKEILFHQTCVTSHSNLRELGSVVFSNSKDQKERQCWKKISLQANIVWMFVEGKVTGRPSFFGDQREHHCVTKTRRDVTLWWLSFRGDASPCERSRLTPRCHVLRTCASYFITTGLFCFQTRTS